MYPLSWFSHTKGHISYYVTGKDEETAAVFTGDTLFIAGCGKFFEGTAEQMYQSLCVTLGSLPKPTRVYCGHEYTVKNLQFALTVEPENTKIAEKLSLAQNQRTAGLPTIPSTIAEELETNPFMRVDVPEVQVLLPPESCFLEYIFNRRLPGVSLEELAAAPPWMPSVRYGSSKTIGGADCDRTFPPNLSGFGFVAL
ncbi:hypothetical protein Cgig2_032257 [Carnegiea gigantea]|uniref:Hydroxyacylglutathione hydrolase C-terminal domain-containing protein n=1 Tax=Carnegiea gigantea TaxID=171969 RepID=A0A9Q1JUJ3_9CARY|nr:hypothetical protein Cgig2_032257 [Carnegiea gigantea]